MHTYLYRITLQITLLKFELIHIVIQKFGLIQILFFIFLGLYYMVPSLILINSTNYELWLFYK